GPQFVGVDGITTLSDSALIADLRRFVEERLRVSEIHPDAWQAVVIRSPEDAPRQLRAAVGDKYSYRELEDFTDVIQRTFQAVKQVTKGDRAGVLDEQVTLSCAQERVAAYGVPMGQLRDIIRGRNTAVSGGVIEVAGRTVGLNPSGEFKDEKEIGQVIIGSS